MLKRLKGFALAEFAVGLVISALMAYSALFMIGIVSKKRSDALITSISNLQKSINIFKTVNNAMPGDLFSAAIERSDSSASIQNNACGNGDGVIAYHSICGDATNLNTNNQVSKCNVASYDEQTKQFLLYNETMLFAKHLSMFGVVEKRVSYDLQEYYGSVGFNEQNTIASGYKKSIFLPFAFSKSTSVNPLIISNDKDLHTFVVSSLDYTADAASTNEMYNETNVTIANNQNSNQYLLNAGVIECSNIPLMPIGAEISYKDADYIDKKIDNGNNSTGNVRYCQSSTRCDSGDDSSKVVLSFLEKF